MKNLIANKWSDAARLETVNVYNPYTNKLIDKVPNSGFEDINKALREAHEIKDLWAEASIYEKSLILESFVEAVRDRIEDLAKLLTKETGKPISESYEEFENFLSFVPSYIERARHLHSEFIPPGLNKEEKYSMQITTRNPIGVVAIFLPSTSPVLSFAHKVPAALLMGNTVILKPSSKAPLTITKLSYLLRDAGIPSGVIQIIHGSGKTAGAALASHPDIQLISFTGSTVSGMKVMQLASQNLTRVVLELGGNDAAIVCKDADLNLAADEILSSRIYNCGQDSDSTKRVLVHSDIKEEFTKILLEKVKEIKIGKPTDEATQISCLISSEAAKKVELQINNLVDEGARVLTGGFRNNNLYYPTILDKVTSNMKIASNLEILGPVIPLISFGSIANAVELANNSPYGLSAAIFTKNLKTAFKVSQELQVGRVIINGKTSIKSNNLSLGAWKYSGFGTEGITNTLEQFSLIKVTVLKDVLK